MRCVLCALHPSSCPPALPTFALLFRSLVLPRNFFRSSCPLLFYLFLSSHAFDARTRGWIAFFARSHFIFECPALRSRVAVLVFSSAHTSRRVCDALP
ncbi:hypothetical protein B0H19DRAFT_1240608 [Mycena capillaripes]|nr:hypothetical protein B0H19DRAFT_1240608 [Mycena capillaripes]